MPAGSITAFIISVVLPVALLYYNTIYRKMSMQKQFVYCIQFMYEKKYKKTLILH